MRMHHRPRIGCAVSPDSVVALVSRRRGAAVPVMIDVPLSDEPLYERIAVAFAAALAGALEPLGKRAAARAVIRVALLPPLAQIRRLALPPMRQAERTRILSREANGYFFGARDAHVATGYALPARRPAQSQVIAAAAPAVLLDALRTAVPGTASIDAFVPAAAAWAAALPRGAGSASIVSASDVATSIVARHALLTEVRHTVVAEETAPTAGTRWTAADAAALAARHAWRARAPLLRTAEQQVRLRRARSLRVRLATAGIVALLAASAGGAYVSLQRQLTGVRQQRAALVPDLAPALAARDSLLRLERRLGGAGILGSGAPWTELLTTVTQTLPANAHIVHMVGAGDSVMLRIEAAAAAEVLPALRVAPVFQDVRIAGAIERDVSNPDAATDRFDVAARIRSLGGQQ